MAKWIVLSWNKTNGVNFVIAEDEQAALVIVGTQVNLGAKIAGMVELDMSIFLEILKQKLLE